jgi:hypothetical protein
MEGKTRRGTKVAGGGAAAEKDGMSRAQRFFFAHVQHFAGDVAGRPDATTPLRGGACCAAAVGAEGAIRQMGLGAGGLGLKYQAFCFHRIDRVQPAGG